MKLRARIGVVVVFLLLISCGDSGGNGNISRKYYEDYRLSLVFDEGWTCISEASDSLLKFAYDNPDDPEKFYMEIDSHALTQMSLSYVGIFQNFFIESTLDQASEVVQSPDVFILESEVIGQYFEVLVDNEYQRYYLFNFTQDGDTSEIWEVIIQITGDNPILDKFDEMIQSLEYLGAPATESSQAID